MSSEKPSSEQAIVEHESTFEMDSEPSNSDYITPFPTSGNVTLTQSSIETPFLPPQFLREYEKTVNGSAQQIFDMIVKQQEFNMSIRTQEMELNRQNLERIKVIDQANINEQKANAVIREKETAIKSRGQIFAFLMGLVLIGVGCYFAYLEHLKLAGLTIGIIVAVMTILFLQKRHNDKLPNDEN